ncbi:Uv-damaged dna-binding protein [Pleurostoma richardsiae]|uniref:Uv-damaged dna-binding protein n=1 Tax=Pleurostoma richardsiae TaxID=41990 RepID=A0AA38VFK4_9PEZI|nr:Uv-damaged dna-binding protein [Pleurostoma richardsiae]
MAIYSAVPPPEQQQAAASQNAAHHQTSSSSASIDIEAWTISALQSLSISPVARGTGAPLSIPLDDHAGAAPAGTVQQQAARVTVSFQEGTAITPPRRPPSRRDSLKRREALLRGKEGSRQRRRYDNARLVDVPNVEPPLPVDWEVRPTYPVRHVPYHIAQYWDKGLRQQAEEKMAAESARRQKTRPAPGAPGRVPRELRDTVRKSPGVKSWVRDLEEPVRRFLVERGVGEERDEEDSSDSMTSEDEEIVFVGRNGSMRDGGGGRKTRDGWKRAHREVGERPVDTGMVFDSLEDDEGSSFKRWLTHSISDYYGLHSQSVTVGNPSRRVVYVGVRESQAKQAARTKMELPRPLWELF